MQVVEPGSVSVAEATWSFRSFELDDKVLLPGTALPIKTNVSSRGTPLGYGG